MTLAWFLCFCYIIPTTNYVNSFTRDRHFWDNATGFMFIYVLFFHKTIEHNPRLLVSLKITKNTTLEILGLFQWKLFWNCFAYQNEIHLIWSMCLGELSIVSSPIGTIINIILFFNRHLVKIPIWFYCNKMILNKFTQMKWN